MLKRVALIAGSIAAVVLVRSKAKQQQAEQDLWTQATDDVRATPSPAPLPASVATIDEPPAHS